MNPSRILRLLVTGCVLALCLQAQTQYATPYNFTTLAGASSIGFRDGPGNTAQFFGPGSLVTDAAGNVFVADEGNHLIRRITPAGDVSTIAGLPGVAGTADGTGGTARFDGPHGLAIDGAGNLYVADTGNHAIRRITPAGAVSTIAGLPGVAGSVDGTGSAARFNQPFCLTVDPSGNLYVTDAGNGLIRKITPAGVVTPFATARFIVTVGGAPDNRYGAIASDASGNIVVSRFDSIYYDTNEPRVQDYSQRYIGYVTRYSPAGTATDLWQTTVTYYYDGRPRTGLFVGGFAFNAAGEISVEERPFSVDGAGNRYYSDFANNTVLKSAGSNETTVLAGIPESTTRVTADGPASTARFVRPGAITVDVAGNAYVADHEAHCIRKITPDGTVTTLAGIPGQSGITDGTGNAARFKSPRGITLGLNGMLYVADTGNHAIRRVSPGGETVTIAGKIDELGHNDGVGPAARFFSPWRIAADSTGNLYVSDGVVGVGGVLRKIAPDGTTTTLLLGGGWYSRPVGSPGTSHEFASAGGLATDGSGNIYFADMRPGNGSIHKITPAGAISTLVNQSASLGQPLGITVDSATGDIFTVDAQKHTVLRVTSNGIAPIAGLVDSPGSADGVGVQARFFLPQGIVLSSARDLYVTSGTTVRKGRVGLAAAIASHPENTLVAPGGSAYFAIVAAGHPAPTYQWNFNGNPIAGATGSSINITGAQAANEGFYTATVTNALGSATSNAAFLTVASGGSTAPPSSGGGSTGGGGAGGGGGAPSLWFLAALLAATTARFVRRHRFAP